MTNSLSIQTPSLVLRHLVPEDAAKLFVMSQEAGIAAWIPDQVYRDERAALEVLKFLIAQYKTGATPRRVPFVLGVCLRNSLELIGHVGLSPVDDQVEIGYAIEEKHQGRGYASEAVSAMSEWAIPHFDLSLILGIVACDNLGSCKVLERSGFQLASEAAGSLHHWQGVVRTYQRQSSPLTQLP